MSNGRMGKEFGEATNKRNPPRPLLNTFVEKKTWDNTDKVPNTVLGTL